MPPAPGWFSTSPAQTGAVSYCRSPGASVRLLIFVTGRQPGTTVFSVPGCPPDMGPEEEEKKPWLLEISIYDVCYKQKATVLLEWTVEIIQIITDAETMLAL